jgi:hypothetical protein
VNQNSSLLGRRVEVLYSFGSIELFGEGLLLDYSDDAILIEQQADQYGPIPAFQVKIPYSWIIRLNEMDPQRDPGPAQDASSRSTKS